MLKSKFTQLATLHVMTKTLGCCGCIYEYSKTYKKN